MDGQRSRKGLGGLLVVGVLLLLIVAVALLPGCDLHTHGHCSFTFATVTGPASGPEGKMIVVVLPPPSKIANLTQVIEFVTDLAVGNREQALERAVVLEFWIDSKEIAADYQQLPVELYMLCSGLFRSNCYFVSSTGHTRFMEEVLQNEQAFIVLGLPILRTYIQGVSSVPVVRVDSLDHLSSVSWLAHLSLKQWSVWESVKININVITQRRAASLRRLLTSLAESYYLGDSVPLHFAVDYADRNRDVLAACSRFTWLHGPVRIAHRITTAGLLIALPESWYPTDDNQYTAIFEDDTSVSPLWYAYTKYHLLNLRYQPQDPLVSRQLAGISLYTPRVGETRSPRETLKFGKNVDDSSFLFQWPCSWGTVFFPEIWREYHVYMATRITKLKNTDSTFKIPGSVTSTWEPTWKKYLVDMIYSRGYVFHYPNFANETSLSTNHLESGVNVHNLQGNRGAYDPKHFTVPLFGVDPVDASGRGLFDLAATPTNATNLLVFDLFGNKRSLPAIIRDGDTWKHDILACAGARVLDLFGYPSCATTP
eukprot:m.239612 g.239612  ORF g.239612 m.239612 type:complete len:539 (-) comp54379_c0_seq2:280-1896(-)